MNEFTSLVASQLRADLRALPGQARRHYSAAGQAARAGTIGELRAAARRRVPRVVFDYVDGAAGDEVTAAANVAALRAIELQPRVLAGLPEVDTATSVLGQPVALPLLGAPMGLTGLLHPAGEVALARAMCAAGSLSVLAAMASCPIEEVAAAARGPVWFQMYIWRDRGLVQDMLQRAWAAGMPVLVLTVDVPCAGNRDRDRRNGFSIPPRVTARALAGGLAHPAWSYRFARRPRISWGNLPGDGGARTRHGAPPSARRPTGSSTRPRPGMISAGSGTGGPGSWWSRASCAPTTPAARCGSAPTGSPSRIMAGGSLTARPRRSGRCPRWPARSARTPRCTWTAASGAAPMSSRRSPWAPGPA